MCLTCTSRPFRAQLLPGCTSGDVLTVDGSSPWANPFQSAHKAHVALLRSMWAPRAYYPGSKINRRWAATELYRAWLFYRLAKMPEAVIEVLPPRPPKPPTFEAIRQHLPGVVLADTCPLKEPCHLTILADIANSRGPVESFGFQKQPPDVRGKAVMGIVERGLYRGRKASGWGM